MRKTILLVFFTCFLSINFYSQTQTKKVYWDSDKTICATCDAITIDGDRFFIFNTPQFRLAFNVSNDDKMIIANVYLLNQSNERIEFDPNKSLIAVYKKATDKQPVEVSPISPEQAAKRAKGGNLLNFFTLLSAGMATQQVQTNSQTSGTATITGQEGITNGTFNTSTIATTTVPNTEAQANARRQVAERNAIAQERANNVLNFALRANTVFPEKHIAGNTYFEHKKIAAFWVGITVGDSIYLKNFVPSK